MLRPDIPTVAAWVRSIDGAVAAWLEGSVARSDADGLSDIDVHVAIADDQWSTAMASRERWLSSLSEILAVREAGGERAWIMSAVLAGPWWIDVTLELASRIDEGLRTEEPLVLFDTADWTSAVSVDDEAIEASRCAQLNEPESSAAWQLAHVARVQRSDDPLLLREYTWRLVWNVIAPAMLLADGTLPRPYGAHSRRLSAPNRHHVETLLSAPLRGQDLDRLLDAAQEAIEAALGRPSISVRRARSLTASHPDG